jgi:hypothetical protein
MKLFYILFFFLAPTRLFAYLDPGTGSLLLYAIVGMIASFVFALRNLGYRLLEVLSSGKVKDSTGINLPDIVFHSEGGRYWQVFQPVLESMELKEIPYAYVTPDPHDPAIEWLKGRSFGKIVQPGNEMITISWLNRITTKIVVSTTPNLDVYMWKRSKHVQRYVHLFHSPTSVDFYEKYALSFYDTILTVGEFQECGINQLDDARGLPRKKLYRAGLSYYDYMLAEISALNRATITRPDTPCVLYAPSWGHRSSMIRQGEKILTSLISSGIRVVFRPHPQSFISDKEVLDDILACFRDDPLFSVDSNRTAIVSMSEADLMITDFSGVLFDYAFLFSKPIILAGNEIPVGGYEAEDISGSLWDVDSAKKLSRPLPDNLDELNSLVLEMIHDSSVRDETTAFRNASIDNFGKAGPVIADRLKTLLGELT